MKKVFFIFCICSFSILIQSCASTSAKNKENVVIQTNNQTNGSELLFRGLQNHSSLSEENIGQTINISGILQKNDTSFYLIENPESRSRVTFIIYVQNQEDISLCSSLLNKKVNIKGILTETPSPWKKTIDFISITE